MSPPMPPSTVGQPASALPPAGNLNFSGGTSSANPFQNQQPDMSGLASLTQGALSGGQQAPPRNPTIAFGGVGAPGGGLPRSPDDSGLSQGVVGSSPEIVNKVPGGNGAGAGDMSSIIQLIGTLFGDPGNNGPGAGQDNSGGFNSGPAMI
jgi:hypothetical protein